MITVHSEDYIVGLFSDMRAGVSTAFWVMAVCSLVLGYLRCGGTWCLQLRGIWRKWFLRNVAMRLLD